MTLSIHQLISKAQSFRPGIDSEKVRSAFHFVDSLYKGHKRFSGDPYIQHILSVLDILLPLKPDEDTIVAALLHGLLGDTHISQKEIRERFGSKIGSMVENLEMLKTVKPNANIDDSENFRQMILTMAKDLRVILIRLADRLHNMQTLDFLPPEKQKFIARETLEIYAPLASRLGIHTFKSRLEDFSFKYLNPTQYKMIEDELAEFGREKGRFIDEIVKTLQEFLKTCEISCVVEGRLKSVYSIYRKMKRKSRTSIRDIFDIFAIRVILSTKFQNDRESIEHLYTVLGFIHSRWTPLANRFKDYVAIPKPNGYQSLHTTVIGLAPKILNQPVEIQIRSERMHREAEYGVASHWLYEDTKGVSTKFQRDVFFDYLEHKTTDISSDSRRLSKQIEWLRGLAKLQEQIGDEENFSEALRLDIFNDRIFVLTPTGEVKDLPAGATPIDFAYSIHTDIGHRCSMAKVNGKIVPLDHELKNGDVVEIILKPKPNPKPLWLGFVKTNAAKMKIKSWFRTQDREFSFREGKDLINKQLIRFNKPKLDENLTILKNYSGHSLSLCERQRIVESVGNGSMPAHILVRKLFAPQEFMTPVEVSGSFHQNAKIKLEEKVLLAGESGLPVRFAQCCSPVENESIFAHITRGQSATVHSVKCKTMQRTHRHRILHASWTTDRKPVYCVKIAVEAMNRIGLIRDITAVISDMSINIANFGYKDRQGIKVSYLLTLDIENPDQLDKLFNHLERVSDILRVYREAE